MSHVTTTKMTSKGQVVIPDQVRKSMGLQAGDQFVVIWEKDAVILKSIVRPSMREFDSLLKEADAQAKKAGLKKADIQKAVKKVRTR